MNPAVVLVGPLSIDRWVDSGDELPGGGALNTAWWLARSGLDVGLVSRVAERDRARFEPILHRWGIGVAASTWVPGPTCSVDVRIGADRQPQMDRFVEGVWADFEPTADEVVRIASGAPSHLVLVDVVDNALHRLAADGALADARLTGDFLGFRHFDAGRFAATMAHLELGFVGWPGAPDDELVARLGELTLELGAVLVVTFGARGVRVFDGRSGRVGWFDVEPQPVSGTTIGCGDAFIAAFLTEWRATPDIDRSVAAGAAAGAATTTFVRPLPDEAYQVS